MYSSSGATLRADLNIKVEEAFRADEFFIGHLAAPAMPVAARSGQYPKLTIANAELLNADATVRAPGTGYGRVTRAWDYDTYDCVDRGLEEAVDDTQRKDLRRFFDAEATAARLTLRRVRSSHEVRVAAMFGLTGGFSSTNAAVNYTAANLNTIDFPRDVIGAIGRIEDDGQMANTIIIPSKLLQRIERGAILKEWIRGTLKSAIDAPINAENIAASFSSYGITRCLVGRGRVNVGKKGQKDIQPAWSPASFWVGYINPNAVTPQDGGAAFTFVWNDEGGLFVTETYREEEVRSDIVRVRQNTTEKIVDSTAGQLIQTNWTA